MNVAVIFWALLWLAAGGAWLATLLGFAGRIWWVFDLFSHFRVQYLVGFSLMALIFLMGAVFSGAGVALTGALINLALVVPLYRKPDPAQTSDSKVYRAASINVLRTNRSFEAARELLAGQKADFAVLVECDRGWLGALSCLGELYPYRFSALREDNYGIALFSRREPAQVETCSFGPAGVPTLVVRFELDGRDLTVIGTHPPPPKSAREARQREAQTREIAHFAAQQAGQVLLCGDLNLTSWSPNFRDILRISGLRDSRVGFGVQPSWPTTNPLMMVPIDHILVSTGIGVNRRWVGPKIGSDHRPVFADFSFHA